MLSPETGELLTSNNLKVHPRMQDLYKFFKYNDKVMDIIDYDREIMNIFSRDVLKEIINGESGWEEKLPRVLPTSLRRKPVPQKQTTSPG